MPANLAALLARLEAGTDRFAAALRAVAPEDLDRPAAPGQFSPRELALHIVDAEIVGAARLRWVAAEPGSVLKAYHGDVWAREMRYADQPLDSALQLFAVLRRSTADMLRALPDSAWANTGKHEEGGLMTLEELLACHCGHAEEHIRELEQHLPHAATVPAV
jgi:hypothetical protein